VIRPNMHETLKQMLLYPVLLLQVWRRRIATACAEVKREAKEMEMWVFVQLEKRQM